MLEGPPDRPSRPVPPPSPPGRAIRRSGWLLGSLAALVGFALFFYLGRQSQTEQVNQPQASTGPPTAAGSVVITGATTTSAIGPSSTTSQTTTPGPVFPGKQPRDIAAAAGEVITSRGISVTAEPIEGIRRGPRDGRQLICAEVILENPTTQARPFAYNDWTLQLPSRVIQGAVLTGSADDLREGELVAGERVSGRVCFNDDSGWICVASCLPGGIYVLFLEPAVQGQPRLAWVNDVLGAPTLTAPPPRDGYEASVKGTCDQQGTCYGVQQRSEPKNDAPRLIPDVLSEGTPVRISCQTKGELKTETDHAPSDLWYRLTNGAYINSIYITAPGTAIPKCT